MNNLHVRFFIYFLFFITVAVGTISIFLVKKENKEKVASVEQDSEKNLFILSDLSESLIEDTDIAILKAEKDSLDNTEDFDSDNLKNVFEKSLEGDSIEKFNTDTENIMKELDLEAEENIFQEEFSLPIVQQEKLQKKERKKIYRVVSYDYEDSNNNTILKQGNVEEILQTGPINLSYDFPSLLSGTRVPIIIDDLEYLPPIIGSLKATIMRNIYAFNASNTLVFPGGASVTLRVLAMPGKNSIRLCANKVITLSHAYVLQKCAPVYDNDFSDSIPFTSNYLSDILDIVSNLLKITLDRLSRVTVQESLLLDSNEYDQVKKYVSNILPVDNTEESIKSFSNSVVRKITSVIDERNKEENNNSLNRALQKDIQESLTQSLRDLLDKYFWSVIKNAVRRKIDTSHILYFILEEDIILKV